MLIGMGYAYAGRIARHGPAAAAPTAVPITTDMPAPVLAQA